MRQWLFEQVQKLLFIIRPDLISVRFTYTGDIERKNHCIQPNFGRNKIELSADEYKEQILKPMGYRFTEPKSDGWMGATRDDWKTVAEPK